MKKKPAYLDEPLPGTSTSDYYDTQRVEHKPHPRDDARGVNKHFLLAYMGATEYEVGGQFASLRRLREKTDIVIRSVYVERGLVSRDVYVVGSSAGIAAALPTFEKWIREECPNTREWMNFAENFAGTSDDFHSRTVAWWPFNADLFFTLDSGVAKQIVDAVADGPTK